MSNPKARRNSFFESIASTMDVFGAGNPLVTPKEHKLEVSQVRIAPLGEKVATAWITLEQTMESAAHLVGEIDAEEDSDDRKDAASS